jgi:hypothetical protein
VCSRCTALAFVTRVRGYEPGRSRWIFQGKNPSARRRSQVSVFVMLKCLTMAWKSPFWAKLLSICSPQITFSLIEVSSVVCWHNATWRWKWDRLKHRMVQLAYRLSDTSRGVSRQSPLEEQCHPQIKHSECAPVHFLFNMTLKRICVTF